MKDTYFRIPMQFFAEPGDGQPAGAGAPADGEPSPTPAPQGDGQQQANNDPVPTGKTFTQKDIDKMITERLAREQKKHADELAALTAKFETEKQEAAKFAKMNSDEKAKYAAEKREQDLTAREAEVQRKELRFEALNVLEQDNLPAKLIGCVDLTSADTCKQSIESIKEAWTEALTAAVDARLRSNDPPPFSGGNNDPKDAFLQGFNEG